MSRVRVLVADDHQILAEGLRGLLEPEFELVGIVSDGREMLEAARELRPDVVVLDITMPNLNGIDAAAQLRAAGSAARVVFLTMHREATYAARAMDAGAAGFVLKHAATSELVTAIREVVQGRTYVTPLIAADLLREYREGPGHRPAAIEQLTVRQREVLQLVAEGHSAKEIGRLLHISARTAEFHRARIMEVIGATGTADLVRFAIQHGLTTS